VERSIEKAGTDIDLFVLSLRRQQEAPPSSEVVVHGNVGTLMTGANATASIVQHFGAEERQALVAALDTLQEAVGAVATLAAGTGRQGDRRPRL
jgi:hypothetical protein